MAMSTPSDSGTLSDVTCLLQRMVQMDSISGILCDRERSEQPLIDMLYTQAKDW
eukprot:g3525.t1